MYPYQIYDLFKLLRTQWKSPEAIKKLQEAKLKRLIHHAYQKVPYYHERLDSHGIRPQDIRKVEDLQILPLTSKKELQALSLEEKIAQGIDPERCKSFRTSGTTGLPLEIYFRQADWTLMNLTWGRAFVAAGMSPLHKRGTLSGKKDAKKRKSWYEHFGLFRTRDISTWQEPEEWIEELRDWKPQVLMGHVMVLRFLGEALQRSRNQDVAPNVVVSTSEALDHFSRQYLKSVFRCKILDVYAAYETGCIAWECEACSGYHMSSDTLVVEVLRDGRPVPPGGEGEMVVTNLHSYAMPFIRYRLGDLVVPSGKDPVCGRGFPLLERIQGRSDDCIVLRNGQKIASPPLYYAITPAAGVRRWRVIQEDWDRLRVEIEPDAAFGKDSQQLIQNNLRSLLGDRMKIEMALVDSIVTHPSLKFRSVSSKIREDSE